MNIVDVQVRRHFRPELLNRLDEIVVFEPLSLDQLRKVARLQMKDVALRLAERGVVLAVTDGALDLVLSEAYDPVSFFVSFAEMLDMIFSLHWEAHHCRMWTLLQKDFDTSTWCTVQVYGARPLRRWLERRVVTQLSRMLINDEIDENSTVYIDVAPGRKELSYRVDKSGGFVDARTGQKSDILIGVPMERTEPHANKKFKIEELDSDDDMQD